MSPQTWKVGYVKVQQPSWHAVITALINVDGTSLLSENLDAPVRKSGTQRCGHEGNLSQYESGDSVTVTFVTECNLSRFYKSLS